MKTMYPFVSSIINAICSIAFNRHLALPVLLLSSSFAFAGGPQLDFRNAQLISGTAGTDGAIYRFPNISKKTDALVTIKRRSDPLVYLVNIDMKTSGFDKAWQPQVGYNNGTVPGPADWWLEFEIAFVEENTSSPVIVDEFNLSGIDIDGNGHLIKEYVSFFGLNSFTVETNSIIVTTNIDEIVNGVQKTVGKKFAGPTVNYLNIDTGGTAVMVTSNYLNVNKFLVRAGGISSGVSGASERMYSFYFQDFKYKEPKQIMLPVKLQSFTATLSKGRATLSWKSTFESNFSHYVIQKSYNGKDFEDISVLFASHKSVVYDYSEAVQISNGGIYYRLKLVDDNGRYDYSIVKTLRVQGNGQPEVVTYPNPVVSELRITIPEHWQNQEVVYDVYNAQGQMVRHLVNNTASQTETLQMSDIKSGLYIIRLRTGDEMATQQIVKAN